MGTCKTTRSSAWRRVVDSWNDTRRDYGAPSCIHQFFEEQVELTPENIALVVNGETITYRELNERSNRLAHYLLTLGACPECWVGICLDRSAYLLIAALAVLKTGAAYAAVDPRHPKRRLDLLLATLKPIVIITLQASAQRLPEIATPLVFIDDATEEISRQSHRNPQTTVAPQNVAYTIYTSGSSGVPKGVAIEHGAASNLIRWAKETIDLRDFKGVLASSSITCDCQLFEIFCPLSVGGTVVLVENLIKLASSVPDREVTLVPAAPTAMAGLLKIATLPASVRTVMLSGEAVQAPLVKDIYSRTAVSKVYNLYGASESSTYSTCILLDRSISPPIPIGRPIANTQLYLLDENLQLALAGEEGEICIGGTGLCRGYINDPLLTSQKFIPNPFNDERGAKLYKTGDVGRYLPDGSIEVIGRKDEQVKVLGFRVELGEITAVLHEHPSVLNAVVLHRTDDIGNSRLLAYVVKRSDEQIDYRGFLASRLPHHMIPLVIELDALPMAGNGKVDLSALPPPNLLKTEPSKESHGSIEKTLTDIISDLLGLTNIRGAERIDYDASFFDLGGHSLIAAQLVHRLHQTFDVDVQLHDIFDVPTIAELAARVACAPRLDEKLKPLIPYPREPPPPVSLAQNWMLGFIEHSKPEASDLLRAFIATRLQGDLDVPRLIASLNAVVLRHEVLRTTFRREDSQWVQSIRNELKIEVPVIDLAHLPGSDRDDAVLSHVHTEARRPFDITVGPLLRAQLLRLSKNEHVLLVAAHHIVFDGWSRVVFFRELSALYNLGSEGQMRLAELPIQYADFSIWQREWLCGKTLDRHFEYWRTKLAQLPAALNLRRDLFAPSDSHIVGGRRAIRLRKEVTLGLKVLSRVERVPSAEILLAVFKILLWRHTGQADFLIGCASANRNRPENRGLIGLFANVLPIRSVILGDRSLRDLYRSTAEDSFAAFSHGDLHVAEIERRLGIDLRFPVMFNVQNGVNSDRGAISLFGIRATPIDFEFDRLSRRDLSVSICEEEECITISIVYNRSAFIPSTIDRLLNDFERQIEAAIKFPDHKVFEIAKA